MGWQFLIIPGWRSTPTSFLTTTDEKWRTGRWSPEGDGGVEEEELQFFSKRFISDFRSQCLVGCFSPVWEHPPTYDREPDINFVQESESEPFVKTVWRLLFSYRIIWFQLIWHKIVLHESESDVDSSLFSEFVVLIVSIFSTWKGVGWLESARLCKYTKLEV